jgi:hypothetical protein
MSHILISIILNLIVPVLVTEQHSLIDWSASRKLKWSDFRAMPPKNDPAAALSSTSIKIDWGYHSGEFKYHIRCWFDQNSSWTRTGNDSILIHEQGHFDIAEIYARRLNGALKKYSGIPEKIKTDVDAIYKNIMQEYYKRQDQYDRDTNFSREKKEQLIWLGKISEYLESLKDLANYR